MQILPPNIEQAFYRIAQESLENISMHASANRIFFSLQEEEGIVRMEIRDNGVGFNPLDDPGPGHYGLRGMQERATSIGADLEVTSQPVTGTIVRLSWERYI